MSGHLDPSLIDREVKASEGVNKNSQRVLGLAELKVNKGFSLSLISFMKWILSTVVTIILVPKLQPVVSEYIQSEFINSFGLGIAIFIITLFVIILIGKTLGKAVTWTGVGSIDKVFGFLFGFFKGYIVCVSSS